jgi:hypothetical protein
MDRPTLSANSYALKLANACHANQLWFCVGQNPRRWYHNLFRPTHWEREWVGIIK